MGGSPVDAMIFKAYTRPDGAYVLVPDCLVASREAHRRHGPLGFVGHLDGRDGLEDPAWRRILADIDQQSYAVVRRATGERLRRSSADGVDRAC